MKVDETEPDTIPGVGSGRDVPRAVRDVVVITAGLAASWAASVALGGTGSIAPHWFYLPILWAGLRFGRRGALAAACVAVVIAGPLLPAETSTWTPQPASDWISRGLFFVGIGLFVTQLFVRLRRAGESERHAAELRTRLDAEARFRVLVESSSDVITVLDEAGNVVSREGPVTAVFGEAPAVLEGRRLDHLLHPEDQSRLQNAVARLLRGDQTRETVLCRVSDGTGGWRHVESTFRDLRGEPAVGGLVIVSRDVSERRALEQQLEHQAHHDALTGLPNRVLLAHRFDSALAAARDADTAVGLLLIDLDRFKDINDTLGHDVGDELLVQVAARLTGTLRATDTVARLGGDEFAVLLPQVPGMPGALAAADKLRAALDRPFLLGGVELSVEASIGAVTSDEHDGDAAGLLQRADIAMYAAKRRGDTAVGYSDSEQTASTAQLTLLGELRHALDARQLVLHYQPKVRLAGGELCGVEALLRWQHPTRGLMAPAEFLPAAEHTGLINPILRYVLDAALAQARIWLDQGKPLPISVNLSARNLLQDDLATQVADMLALHGVPAAQLELELTESAIMLEPDRARERLVELADLGVQIAIDDFGAGYTSLGHLKDLPVSQLKVDRSFVAAMATDPASALIVRSIVDLGHNLGLATVAEGVETAAEVDVLRTYGCDTAQGYYLSRPMPASAIDTWRASTPTPPRVPTQSRQATSSVPNPG